MSPILIKFSLTAILIALVCLKPTGILCAQPANATYANSATPGTDFAGIGNGSVTSPADATNGTAPADQKPNEKYANISVTSTAGLVYEWLHLTFPAAVTASALSPKTVYVRVNEGTTALLGSSVAMTAYNNTSGTSNSITTQAFKTYYLADGTILMAITIASNFRSVRVTLTSPIALGTNTLRVYYAYYNATATNTSNPFPQNTADCGLPNYTTDTLASGLVSLARFSNQIGAIDADSVNTKSSFQTIASLSGLGSSAKMKQVFYFKGVSNPGDAVRVTVSQGMSIVSATLLSKISVQAYNGLALAGTSQLVNTFIEADLLNVVGSTPVSFYFAPKNSSNVSQVFDRIEVSLEIQGLLVGLSLTAGLFYTPLNIHDVRRVPDAPTATLNAKTCSNVGTVALQALSTAQDALLGLNTGLLYKWYNAIRTGNPLSTSNTYDPSGLTMPGVTSYYVNVTKSGCTGSSVRRKVDVTVSAAPVSPGVKISP